MGVKTESKPGECHELVDDIKQLASVKEKVQILDSENKEEMASVN